MNLPNLIALENLESRTFLSATLSPTLTVDLAQIKADRQQLVLDATNGGKTLLADHQKLVADATGKQGILAPLIQQLKDDIASRRQAIQADLQNGAALRKTDKAAVFADLKQIVSDLFNPSALKADKAKLLADTTALRAAFSDVVTVVGNTLKNYRSTLLADQQAVIAARHNNPSVNADRAQILADRQAELAKIHADRVAIRTDIQKFISDRKAGL